jgi:hypothetical protein
VHRRYLHIISWILLLTFFVSNTGFAIYTHVCHTSNSQSVSIFGPEYCALDTPYEDDCCALLESEQQETDDCCDEQTTFAKLHTEAKQESSHSLLYTALLLDLSLPVLLLNGWQPTLLTADRLCTAHPPEPNIYQPISVQERLSLLASFLC